MSPFRQRLLQSYQVATQRWRERISEELRTRQQMPGLSCSITELLTNMRMIGPYDS